MQTTNIVFAEPKNAKLLTGEKRRIGSSFIMIILALIGISGAVIAGYMWYTFYANHQAILTEGKQVRGVIVDGFAETSRSFYVIETTRYRVTYRYQVGGQNYEMAQDIDAAIYDQLRLQSPVTVAYLPANPAVAELAGDFADTTEFRNAMLTLGAVTIGAALIAAYFLFVDARNRRLSSQGQMLDGVLTSANGQYSRRGLNITFNYQFRSPHGDTLKGARTVQRNDLRKQSLPTGGSPVKVLYVNDKLHRIL